MKVKIHVVHPPIGEEKMRGPEPSWPAGYVPKDYDAEIARALSWHARCAGADDYHQYIEEWISIFRSKTAKKDLAEWETVPTSGMVGTYPSLARMRIRGFPVKQEVLDKMWDFVQEKIAHAKANPKKVKENKPRVSVKERIERQVDMSLGAVDELLDKLAAGEQPDLTPTKTELLKPEFKGPHLRMIVKYISEVMAEFEELQQVRKLKKLDDQQEQLVEGYAYLKPRTLTRLINTLSDLRDSIGKQAGKMGGQRVRRQKPVDKQKQVSKLRFKKEDKDLGITGVDPVELLGASEAWVYDTKRRKLHFLVGEHAGALFVGGPKIRGLGKQASCKTLRKPKEQLTELLEMRKNQTVIWYDKIQAKAGKTTGRTTEDMILVRVIT
jgi:hypothetical protein